MAKKEKEAVKTITMMVAEMGDLMAEALEDAKKFDEKSNKAAGTRVRKAMQASKKMAQAIRLAVGEAKAAE